MKDLKYLVAYILPFTTALGLYWQGGWAWATVLLIFGILPVLELWTPSSTQNIPPLEEDNRAKRWFFNILLYLNDRQKVHQFHHLLQIYKLIFEL